MPWAAKPTADVQGATLKATPRVSQARFQTPACSPSEHDPALKSQKLRATTND